MPTLIDPTQIPGAALEPDDIDAAARRINLIGSSVSSHGVSLLRTWQQLEHSYQAPEHETLVHVMSPVKGQTSTIGSDLKTVSTALRLFAEDVRPIKAALRALTIAATTFVADVEDGTTSTIMGGAGYPVKIEDKWDVNDDAVDRNNALIAAVNDQVELLWAAERRCANTVLDLTGHARLVSGEAPNASAATAYGVTAIAPGTRMDWGAEGEIPRTRIRAINDALGDVTVDTIVGVYATVGIDASDPEHPAWRPDEGLAITTNLNRIKGFGQLAATVGALSPTGQIAARTDTAFGAAARKQQSRVVAAGRLFQRSWESNPWGTGTKVMVVAGSCLIPGAGWAKTATTAARGARLASKAVEKSSETARLARIALKQSRAAGLAEHAVRTGVRTLEMSPSDMKKAVKQLQESLGAPERALDVRGTKDLTLLMERDVHARAKNLSVGHPDFARAQARYDRGASVEPEGENAIAKRDAAVGQILHDWEKGVSGQPGAITRDADLAPSEIYDSEIDASKVWTSMGRDVHMVKAVQNVPGRRTADLIVDGVGRVEIYSPKTQSSLRIVSTAVDKAAQCNFLHIGLETGQLDPIDIARIPRRVFGNTSSGRKLSAILVTVDGKPVLYESRRI